MDADLLWLQQQALQKMNIRLDADQLDKFDRYKSELRQWNQKINLISETSAREIVARHFWDSLTPLPFINASHAKMMDVGCGAGFPGLPLKIVIPELEIYLLEANRKKVTFLKHMIRLLELEKVMVIHDRVENLMRKNLLQAQFDFLVSRAAFSLSELQRFCDYFLNDHGILIALKGANAADEIKQCQASKNRRKISQFIQHDMEPDFLGKPRKIIIGKP